MTHLKHIAASLAACAALAFAAPARAATSPYCAASAAEIETYFGSAEMGLEGTSQEIRIERGTYYVDQSLEFNPDGSRDNKNFKLSGGWGSGCADGSQIVNPANTILKFTAADADFRKVTLQGDNASFVVEGIRFDGFSDFFVDDNDCALFSICPDTETISLRYNEFRNANRLTVYANDARTVVIKNNLFDHFNGYSSYGGLVSLYYRNNETAPDVAFNTFGSMACQSSDDALFAIYTEKDGGLLHHNIFDHTGCSADVDVLADNGSASFNKGNPISLLKNVYKKLSGLAPVSQSNNLVGVAPGFANAAGYDFSLRTTIPASALIDAGLTPGELLLFGLIPPGHDLDGGTRLSGLVYDPGAIEAPGVTPGVYTVVNTQDSGTGSLRDAILKTNQAAGKQTIKFDIPGACPHKILLQTELDPIVDDVEIDGYSQPGSNVNSQKIGSNATVCVEVGPAVGTTLQYGFKVPDTAPASTQLTLDGIAFTGGHTLALDLSGGAAHYVWGNAFGGVRPGGLDKLGDGNVSHLIVRKKALGAVIGGDELRERNWFGSSQLNAILLLDASSGGHTVQGNYIGLDPGGGVAQPIGGNAISAQDSAGNRILGNLITGSDAGVRISGATATAT